MKKVQLNLSFRSNFGIRYDRDNEDLHSQMQMFDVFVRVRHHKP